MRTRTRRGTASLAILIASAWALSGCAAAGATQPRGTSGPVAWEFVDIRQTTEGPILRWNYTLVLKETAGVAIEFEKAEISATGARLNPLRQETDFRGRLGPNSETRIPLSWGVRSEGGAESFGAPAGAYAGMTLLYRLRGKDERGDPVTVDARLELDPHVGRTP